MFKLSLLIFSSYLAAIGFNINTTLVEDKPPKICIYWSPLVKLNQNDFLGEIDTTSVYDAVTITEISVNQFGLNKDSIKLNITNCFRVDLSWLKTKYNEELFHHEMGHFNISEYCTRVLRKKLSSHISKDITQTGQTIKDEHANVLIEYQKLTDKYDFETEHGKNIKKQKLWDVKIKKMINGLSCYKEKEVYIMRKY